MSSFKFKTRDVVGNDQSRKFEVVDADGESYGTFDVKFRDISSPRHTVAIKSRLDRLSKSDYKRVVEPKTDEDRDMARRFNLQTFIDNYIVGSDIPGAEDSEAVYKHDPAILLEYLAHADNGFISDALYEFASDVQNFRRENEDAAKNG